jgi:acetylglutamate kinase
MNDRLYIIKIGGNIIDDEKKLSSFLLAFASLEGRKILVHGGGKLATKLATQLGIEQKMIDGRRITDAETLKIVTMVYAGYINKNIVAQLQSYDCNAVGLCGADGNLIQSHKRASKALSKGEGEVIDYGFAGDVDAVNTTFLKSLLDQNINVVIAPITHDKKGLLLNTNADTIAQEIAQAMSNHYEVNLIYSFEKPGVLLDVTDERTVIPILTKQYYEKLKASTHEKRESIIFAGMIPKLDNAFVALNRGVQRVIIGKAEELKQLTEGKAGTNIILQEISFEEKV